MSQQIGSSSTSSTTWCQVETDFSSTLLRPGQPLSSSWILQRASSQRQFPSADITIDKFHNGLPRFGHSSDLLEVINEVDNKDMQKDYALGIFLWVIIIGVFFVCWGCVIVLLKYAGVSQVGMFAGSHPPRPQRPTKPSKKRHNRHTQHKKKGKTKHTGQQESTPAKVKLIQKDGVTVAVSDDDDEESSPSKAGVKYVQKDGVMVAVPPAPPLSVDGSKARKKKRELEASFATSHQANEYPNQADSAATTKTSSTAHTDHDGLSHHQNPERPHTSSHPMTPPGVESPTKRRRNHVKLVEDDEIVMSPPGVESPRRRRRQHVQLVEDDDDDEIYNDPEASYSQQRLSHRGPDNPEDYKYRTELKSWRIIVEQRAERLFRIRVTVAFALMGMLVALLAGLYYQGAIQTHIIGNNARGASFSSLGDQANSKSFSNFVQDDVGLVALGIDMAASNMRRFEQTTQRGVEVLNQATTQQRVVLEDTRTLFDAINGKKSEWLKSK